MLIPIRPVHIALAAALVLAASAAALPPTPATGTGPFYPVDESGESDNDLTRVAGRDARPQGETLYVEGTVLDVDGQPVAGAELVIWQTDAAGFYDHPGQRRVTPDGRAVPLDSAFQYWGTTVSDDAGRYRFVTIVPGHYGNGTRRPAHVHFKISHPGFRTLASEMQFPGDEQRRSDFVTSADQQPLLEARISEVDGEPGSKRALYDLVLRRR